MVQGPLPSKLNEIVLVEGFEFAEAMALAIEPAPDYLYL